MSDTFFFIDLARLDVGMKSEEGMDGEQANDSDLKRERMNRRMILY